MKQTALQATAIRLPHTILREQTADALNTTAGDAQATAGAFIASATGTEGSTYVLNDNQGATEASGTIDVGPVNASEESTHALNAETGKADLSQSERAAMRANIDYQTTTVIKEE